MIKGIKKFIKDIMKFIYRLMVKTLPVSKDIILFESNLGRNYTGNPRAIYERMVELGLDKKYRIVWIFNDPKEQIPGTAKE